MSSYLKPYADMLWPKFWPRIWITRKYWRERRKKRGRSPLQVAGPLIKIEGLHVSKNGVNSVLTTMADI